MNKPSIQFNSSVEQSAGLVQTLSYTDDGSQWEVSMPSRTESTHDITPVGDVSLENFLSRPIFLPAKVWTPGVTGFVYQFNPWTLFLGNKRVSNRLNNFKLLSCDMCVKVMVNGNGFYYGRLMMDYRFATGNDVVDLDDGTVPAAATIASQRMHIFIDPTSSQGGTLHIPFMSLRNKFSVTTGDWDTDIGGACTIRELNPLKHANAATTPVELVIALWAENVKLSVPTAVSAYGLTAQAGEESVVSRVASATESAAEMVSNVPVIGPYATAAGLFARGLGGLAHQFGFSRPAILREPEPMRPSYVGSLANGDRAENVEKLTLDSKQGLTVDSSVIGVTTPDEMSIATLLEKESFLTTFPWLVTTATDTTLWNCRVTPSIFTLASSLYYLPACAFATIPFKYWRGCMKYRFQIVASQFHKGRLRIAWDPDIVPASPEANVEYTRVIDISTERDVEVVVKWGNPFTWLKCGGVASANHSTSRLTSGSETTNNGILSVCVLNTLTTPNSVANNDISVNVFVSMMDGEVSVPTDAVYKILGQTYSLTVQSGDEDLSETNNDPAGGAGVVKDISDCVTAPGQNLVFIGEVFTSFRTLLKRYNFYRTDLCPNTAAQALWSLRGPNFPSYKGYASQTHDATATGKKFNYVASTLLNYLAPAYTVMRGGIRWKAILYTAAPSEILSPLSVERGADSSSTSYSNATNDYITGGGTTSGWVAYNNATYKSGMYLGGTVTPHARQPALEFELPFYSQDRGCYARNVAGAPGLNSCWQYQHKYQLLTTGTTAKFLDRYVATGEDFQLLLFQGCPPLGLHAAAPAPA